MTDEDREDLEDRVELFRRVADRLDIETLKALQTTLYLIALGVRHGRVERELSSLIKIQGALRHKVNERTRQ